MLKPLVLALSCALSFSSLSVAAEGNDADVLVRINDAEITRADYNAYLGSRQQRGQKLPPQTLIDELVARELLFQQGVKEKLEETESYKQKMQILRYNLLGESMQGKFLAELKLTDEDIKKKYDELIAAMPKQAEYKARHILVETEEEAKAILDALKEGKDFAELATEKSKDPGSGKNGGDLGWFNPSHMVKPFADALATLKKDELSAPVQSQFGWHVIKLEDTRDLAPPAFDGVKAQVEQRMQSEAMQKYLESLKMQSNVKFTDAFEELIKIVATPGKPE